jgi:hypothetical protein
MLAVRIGEDLKTFETRELLMADLVEKAAGDLVEVEAGHAFWVRSAYDIFRKLHREKRRFERAESSREGMSDQVDAAINFAITAWHMTDWVWVQHEDKLREHFHVNSKRKFQDEMRRLCPGLAACDVIANAAKHGGVAHDREDRPGIETVLIAHPVGEGSGGPEVVAVLAQRRWSLIIEVDGIPQDPSALFDQVFLFWHRFIQQHCVAQKLS